jgi:pimeloyl-ACP methyl ester carboxylesterase
MGSSSLTAAATCTSPARWIRRIVISLSVLVVSTGGIGAAYQAYATHKEFTAYPPPGQLVDVGGHRLHIWCTGKGVPTVVLDTGLGGTAFDWGYVQPEVAKFTRVCSYDRAGVGFSESGPHPRTSRQIVKELATLLASSVQGNVILVGASIGGWNVRVFASEQPQRVAGLVLVDARHENQGERLAEAGAPENPPWVAYFASPVAYTGIARLLDIVPGLPVDSYASEVRKYVQATRFRASALVTAANELRYGSVSAAQVRSTRRELKIPVVVISAGLHNLQTREVLAALQRDQATLSKQSCHVIAERSGHAIAFGQPEIVVDAIRATVEASQLGAAPRSLGGPDVWRGK